MHIKAEKTTTFVIRLTLGEALAVLTDPAPLQKEIRALLPAESKHPRVGATRRVARPEPARPPKARKTMRRVTCPECGKEMGASGLGNHRKKLHGVAPAAA
jgi:hypothetical protein